MDLEKVMAEYLVKMMLQLKVWLWDLQMVLTIMMVDYLDVRTVL
jgi:hypothetical protein